MRAKMGALVFAPVAAMALGTGVAHADTAKDFNGFVFGTYNGSNSDTEGRLAVGGSATFSSYGVGGNLGSGFTGDSLVVGGALSYTNGQVFYGNVRVGGAATGAYTVAHGTTTSGSGTGSVNFSTEVIRLRDLSTQLATRAATGTTTYQYGGLSFAGAQSGLNVFTVSGAQLASANSFSLSIPTNSFALFNIDGSVDQMQNFGFSLNGAAPGNILYNFSQATTLSLSGIGVQGSILAPFAATQFANGNINGTLIVNTLSGSGELHYVPYQGTLLDPAVAAIPEPASWAMMIGGFALVGGMARRRRTGGAAVAIA